MLLSSSESADSEDSRDQTEASSSNSNQIYVYDSMKIEDPRNTLIKREPHEDRIKVLIVPEQGDQKLIIFRLPTDMACTVEDFLKQLKSALKSEVDSAYLVTDSVHNVRYVVNVRAKSVCDKKVDDQLLTDESNQSSSDIVNLVEDRTSVTSYSCLRKNTNIMKVQTLIDTKRLTLHLRRNSQIILKYPLSLTKGRITITIEDFKCLSKGRLLNDIIIDFYMKYLILELLPSKARERVYMFNSYFYTRLSHPRLASLSLEPLAQHAQVKRWTKNVNIFEKDFVIIPVHQSEHWFLVVICYPGLLGVEINQTSKSSTELRFPCILIFDSLSFLNIKRSRVVQELKSYLRCEYSAKMGINSEFSEDDIMVDYPAVPQQYNSSDCGVYLLQYVETFLKDFVITNRLRLPIKTLWGWFDDGVIKRKREELKKLLIRLAIDSRRNKSLLTCKDY